jgi:uncharacterized protein YrrD
MIYRLRNLFGLHIRATDGDVGSIKDIYFDDHSWTLRYLVVETGNFFAGRQVLISPVSVAAIDWDTRAVRVTLDMAQIRASPPTDTDKPVSRQHESDFFDYYGYPYYWTDPSLFLAATSMDRSIGPAPVPCNAWGIHSHLPFDPRLRSAREVTGYALETTTERVGHVEDFLVDSISWAIRYLVADTRNWLPGRHVVIPPAWIRDVDWQLNTVRVDVSADSVKHAPEFDSDVEFSRANEATMYRHYQRDPYWS